MPNATLTQVAEHAGVSLATASRVLNGSDRHPAAAIADRVRKSAETLGYLPNAQAQALARASTSMIGLVVHDIADPYFSSIAKGVQLAAAAGGRQVLLSAAGTAVEAAPAMLQAVRAFASHRTEAIILAGTRTTTGPKTLQPALRAYLDRGGRLVTIGQAWFKGASAVRLGNRRGTRELVSALTADGQSRFVYLAGPSSLRTQEDRLGGYQDGIRAAGAEHLGLFRGEFNAEGGRAAARELLREMRPTVRRPVTVLAGNDVMALGAVGVFLDAGLTIGRQVRVAGFDDIDQLADSRPQLTTYRLPLQRIGELAAGLALDPQQSDPPLVTGEVIRRETA